MPTIADLTARFSADTRDLERGGQVAQQTLKGVQQQAETTTRALQIMADAAAKANPNQGSAAQILEIFQRSNVQPTAAALTQARSEMDKMAASAAQAVQPTQAVARAARDHAEATASGARAAQNAADGWKISESSLVRFGAGLAGISLGLSLVAGAARLVHDAIEGIVVRQLDWERSLRTLSGLYGQAGAQSAAVANAQANLPGVLGTQGEFAQAAINASGLRLRYGISQETIDQLTTTGGRLAYATGMTDAGQRSQLQAQILAAATTGAPLPPQYGVYTDPEAVARRLGLQGAASLQTFTPQELIQARSAIVSEGGSQFADRAQANQRAALDAATAAAKAADTAASNLTNYLENGVPYDDSRTRALIGSEAPRNALEAEQQQAQLAELDARARARGEAGGNIQGLGAIDAEGNVMQATERYVRALANSTHAQENSQRTFDDLGHSVDAAGARLITFFGSLEDATSIAHGDLLAQAQAGLTARARSAIPTSGMSNAEIGAIARGTTSAQIWQNYVAELAQGEGTDAVRRNLQVLAGQEGPGLEAQRGAAQRALASAPQLDVINRGLGSAQRRAAQADLDTADTQSRLDAIALTQRERQLQLLRDTVDLRRLDVQQQQAGLRATEAVIRAQQAALPIQATVSAARYQQTLAGAISLQRMARLLQGRDVSDLPSVDQLIGQNYEGQLTEAEAAPDLVRAQRGIEVAQQPATAASLAQALTEIKLRSAEMAVELKNLDNLPAQTALESQLVKNNVDQLSVQTEIREYMKAMVFYLTQQRTPQLVPADRDDRIAAGAPRAPSELAGARR